MKRLLAMLWAPAREAPHQGIPPDPVVEHIATALYPTTDEGGALLFAHVCVFARINGERASFVQTTNEIAAATHSYLLVHRSNWAYHGDLPDHARRIGAKRSADIIVFPGGGDAA